MAHQSSSGGGGQPPSQHAKPVVSGAKPAAISMGVTIEGTDDGALSREFFFVEASTPTYRTVLPHGHITLDMYGGVASITYTSRLNSKTSVYQPNDWNVILADSAPIYNAMCAFFSG
ncbi:MAG: hypothetical protein QM749_08450 [Aquabacterium sp.]